MAVGDQFRRIQPSDMLVFDKTGALAGVRSGQSNSAEGRLLPEATSDSVQALVSGDGVADPAYANTNPAARYVIFSSPTDIGAFSGVNQTNLQDFSQTLDGVPILSITQVSPDTSAGVYKTFTANGQTGTAITVDVTPAAMKSVSLYWFFPPQLRNQTPTGNWDVFIGSDAFITTLTNRVSTSMSFGPMAEGWNVNSARIDSMTVTGAPVYTAMRKVQVKVNSSLPGTVGLGMLAVGFRHKPKVVLMVDDAYEEQHSRADLPTTSQGRPGGFFTYLESKGMKGTIGVISSFVERTTAVGAVKILTMAQLREMYDAGHDLAVHGQYGFNNWTSYEAAERDIANTQRFLKSNGWHRAANLFVYPEGFITADARTALRRLGFASARALFAANVTTAHTQPAQPFVHDMYALNAVTMGNVTASTMNGYVDRAVSLGQTLFLYGHQFLTGSGTTGSNLTTRYDEFTAMVDYVATLRDAGTLDVVTYSQWVRGVTGVRPY